MCARIAAPRRALGSLALLAAVSLFAPPLRAQSTLVVEGRAGVSVPTGSAPRAWPEPASGSAAGVHFALRRGARSYLYLGFSQLRTPCEGEGCGDRSTATQWEAGVRFDLRTEGVVPWLRAGAITPSIENAPLGAGPDSDVGLSDRGWGGEVGGGLRFPLGERFGVSPGARLVVSRVGAGGGDPVTLRWIVFDVGLTWGF